ncbi:glycine-rich domain-containing protein [Streptomyces alboflavus]|uniref:glycine-rich domain-containing protein n=1 Tax=Streptomyces alboflavus TaxID=67267 RepID=UPI0036C8FD40
MSTAVKLRDPKTFVSADVWEREVKLIMRDPETSRGKAERLFGQTIAYFVTAGENPDALMGPSKEVDKGVHSFMLDTIPFHQFTYGHFGRYIHHVPEIAPGDGQGGRPLVLEQTIKAIQSAGFSVDGELWDMKGDCNQCYAGCTDSPNSGKGKK